METQKRNLQGAFLLGFLSGLAQGKKPIYDGGDEGGDGIEETIEGLNNFINRALFVIHRAAYEEGERHQDLISCPSSTTLARELEIEFAYRLDSLLSRTTEIHREGSVEFLKSLGEGPVEKPKEWLVAV